MEYSLFLIEGKELCFVERADRDAVASFRKEKSKDHLLETFGNGVAIFPLVESLGGNLLLAYDLRRDRGIGRVMKDAVIVNLTGREVVVEVKWKGRVGRLVIEGNASVVRRPALEFF